MLYFRIRIVDTITQKHLTSTDSDLKYVKKGMNGTLAIKYNTLFNYSIKFVIV